MGADVLGREMVRQIRHKSLKVSFKDLKDVTAIIYGTVISYALFVFAGYFNWKTCGLNTGTDIASLLINFFVLNFLITDFVEAWVITSTVGYTGRVRFTIDIAIAALLLFAVSSSSSSSYVTFLLLSIILFLGAAWSFVLNYELSGLERIYPLTLIGTHVAAAIWIFWFYVSSVYNFDNKTYDLTKTYASDGRLAVYIWTLYIVISIVLYWFKKWWRQPDIVFDLLPVAITIRMTEWTLRCAAFLILMLFATIFQVLQIESKRLQEWKMWLKKERDAQQ